MPSTRSLFVVALALLLAAPAAGQRARGSWWQRADAREYGYYSVKSDLSPQRTRELARHLNLMYEEYARRLASLPPRVPESLNVMMFADREDYELTLMVRYSIDAKGTGGMFFSTGEFAALAFWVGGLSERRVQHVMQHEAFHQFAASRFGNDLPMWVNEGLAEFFGEAVLFDGTFMLGMSTPRVLDPIKEAIEAGTTIPFEEMLGIHNGEWNRRVRIGAARLQYNQAWSMVQFLIYGEQSRWQRPFEDFLRRINAGTLPDRAFVEVFGSDIGAFETRWKAWAANVQPSAFLTALERMEFLANGILALPASEPKPETLDALREALVAIDYEQKLDRHGRHEILRAGDAMNFEIPKDDRSEAQPLFELEKSRRTRSAKERLLDETNPRPFDIVTTGLTPKNLRLRWVRDEETNTFSYRIDTTR